MIDRKNYYWLIPGVLVLGLVFGLVFTFQPVLAGSSQSQLNSKDGTGLQRIMGPNAVAAPEAEINPTCVPNTTGAISYWPLNETGPKYADMKSTHHGDCSGDNCPSSITGTNAGGQFFIDTDPDAITVPTNVAFDFLAADPFSAGIWVKTTQNCTGNKVFIGRYGTAYSEGRWWLGCVSGGSPGEGVARFHMRDSDYVNSRSAVGSTPINDGKWHYLTGVWDGTDTLLYVDGVEEAKVSLPAFSGNFISSQPLTIGAFNEPTNYYTTGALDEAAVFDVALSKTFIDNYRATCDFSLNVGDVTLDTSMNVNITPIESADLYANSTGAGALSIAEVDGKSEIQIRFSGSDNIAGTAPAGPFTYTPPTDYVGTDFFTFIVDDGVNTARGTAIITMEAPQVTNPGPQIDNEGAVVSLEIEAIDPNGDDLTYEATGLPVGLTIDAVTGLISGNVATGAAGSYDPVTVTVTDDKGYASYMEFVWTITDNNLPPVVIKPADQVNIEGDTVSLQVQTSDPNGDSLTYTAIGLPDGLSINSSSGLITGDISAGASASSPFTVKVKATDPGSLFDEETFSWTVKSTLFLPVIFKTYP